MDCKVLSKVNFKLQNESIYGLSLSRKINTSGKEVRAKRDKEVGIPAIPNVHNRRLLSLNDVTRATSGASDDATMHSHSSNLRSRFMSKDASLQTEGLH